MILELKKITTDKGTSYNYESSHRVCLDENKSVGSLLCYSVYGDTRLEAAKNLLNSLKRDEEEFDKLRRYYSIKGKNLENSDIIIDQKIGDFKLLVTKV